MKKKVNTKIKDIDDINNEINRIEILNKNAYNYLEQNNLENVAQIIKKLEKYENIYSKMCLSCLYIDFGSTKKDESLLIKGINLIENNKEEIIKISSQTLTSYNLVNGYSSYYSLTKNKFLNDENIIIKIKNLYKKAAQSSRDPKLTVQILVNLGNFYNHFGRHIDALEYYEKVLKIDSTHGMALVNKGQSLIEYKNIVEHNSPMLLDAYYCFKNALKSPNLTYEGRLAAEHYIKIFETNNKKSSLTKKNKPKIDIKSNSKDLKSLSNSFCYNNKLYLNLCNFCQKCDNSIGDTITIKRMTLPLTDEEIQNDTFLILSSYLNQIKMDFISARLNLILYQYKELDLNFVNENVVIIDSLNYEMHNIRIQLIKDSFKSFYDILDKIAFFINRYYNLGIKEHRIDFKSIWFRKKKKLNKKLDFNNAGLKALFDIYEDIYENTDDGYEKKFKDIRNTLTHRILKIKLFLYDGEKDTMTDEELLKVTIDLAKLVRNAIIYLMAMVDIEESKKDDLNAMPLFAQEIPNNLK